jgi:energy-coupling factor transport system permease protein
MTVCAEHNGVLLKLLSMRVCADSIICYAIPVIRIQTYSYGTSCVHKLDARVKFLLLLAFTILTFALGNFGVCISLFVAILGLCLSKVPVRLYKPYIFFVGILCIFAIILNTFTFQQADITLVDEFGVSASGFVQGCFYALRIIALVWISLVYCFTTAPEQMISSLVWLLGPLRVLHVPVSDIAMVLTLALRFIPLIAQDVQSVALAQAARGSRIYSGNFFQRLRAWVNVFIPLLVRLFKRAEYVGTAMDARCYGASTRRA